MPNRILKESICTSESINMLSPFEETVFYRLIVSCDDFGRFDGRAAIIRARLFPLKSVTDKQVDDAVEKLRTVGMVVRYEVDGKAYVQLAAWDSHQQRRAQKSKYPSPVADTSLAGAINCNQLQSDSLECENVIVNEYPPNPPRGEVKPKAKPKAVLDYSALVSELTPSEAIREAAMGWIEMRCAKGKRYAPTERAVRLAFSQVRSWYSRDEKQAVACFNQATIGGWQGLFQLKG